MKKTKDTLRVIRVSAKVANKDILHDVTFDVQKGSVHVIMGPNGSGKSTIANVLMGHQNYITIIPDYSEWNGYNQSGNRQARPVGIIFGIPVSCGNSWGECFKSPSQCI
jgi:ABC-type hemin transport system ATPase subunit